MLSFWQGYQKILRYFRLYSTCMACNGLHAQTVMPVKLASRQMKPLRNTSCLMPGSRVPAVTKGKLAGRRITEYRVIWTNRASVKSARRHLRVTFTSGVTFWNKASYSTCLMDPYLQKQSQSERQLPKKTQNNYRINMICGKKTKWGQRRIFWAWAGFCSALYQSLSLIRVHWVLDFQQVYSPCISALTLMG